MEILGADPVSSIYSKLYRYRERPRRSPLEDYSTEALADLLSRCPLEIGKEFIAKLLVSEQAKSTWMIISDSLQGLTWNTQVTLPDGRRPDLVIQSSDGDYLFVVESKLASPIREYDPTVVTSENKSAKKPAVRGLYNNNRDIDETKNAADLRNQLEVYGAWLATQRRPNGWKGGLTLLTHFTKPPEDFLRSNALKYGSTWNHCVSWAAVFRWLKSQTPSKRFPQTKYDMVRHDCTWKSLAREFSEFLREKNMSAEQLTSSDLSAAALFIGSTGRIENTFERIRQETRDTFNELKSGNMTYWEFDESGRVIWEYFYLKKEYAKGADSWYVAWGIRFPEQSSCWKDAAPALPAIDQVFVNLASNKGISPEILTKLRPRGWSISDKELVIARPVVDFFTAPDQFGEVVGHWVNDRLLELKNSLSARDIKRR